jgi:hypothetical protein
VIHAIDESVRALIRRDVIADADIEVVFEAPTKEWAARRNSPTIDVYLYDIREDLRRRQLGLVDLTDDDGHTVARRQPPRFFKLSYLMTAWTQRTEDEHRLLAALLECFLRRDHIPEEVMVDELRETGVPFAVTLAIPPPEDRALSDVWSALGGELKPSLDLVVIAPWDLDRREGTAGPVLSPPRVLMDHPGGGPPEERTLHRPPAAAAASGQEVPADAPESAATTATKSATQVRKRRRT